MDKLLGTDTKIQRDTIGYNTEVNQSRNAKLLQRNTNLTHNQYKTNTRQKSDHTKMQNDQQLDAKPPRMVSKGTGRTQHYGDTHDVCKATAKANKQTTTDISSGHANAYTRVNAC